MDEYKQTIMAWINENCMRGKTGFNLEPDTSLLVHDILDSLDFMSLVEHLQTKYSIEIDEDDMSPENFESVNTIANLVATLTSS